MNKLKVRFMSLVCQFIGDWYSIYAPSHTKRIEKITSLMEDLKEEYDEE